MNYKSSLSAISIFCGCGGFDLGAIKAGFRIVGAFDNDPVAVETYHRNISSNAEVANLKYIDLREFNSLIDLVIGGPPCQGFSSAGSKIVGDKRNILWKSYINVLKQVRPKAFVLENVTGFLKEYDQFSRAVEDELNGEYVFEFKKINTQFYSVPQRRIRVFIVGMHRDICKKVSWPKPSVPEKSNQKKGGGWHIVEGMISMENALSDLGPAKPAKYARDRNFSNPHEYVELESSHSIIAPHVPNGGSIRSIPDANLPSPYKGRSRERNGWLWYYRKPNPLLPARTVTAAIGPTFTEILAPDVINVKKGTKWTWEIIDPATYLSIQGLYSSPVKSRRLTVKECARLQEFPDNFEIFGNFWEKHRQIGNAVPIGFAKQLCTSISDAIKSS